MTSMAMHHSIYKHINKKEKKNSEKMSAYNPVISLAFDLFVDKDVTTLHWGV